MTKNGEPKFDSFFAWRTQPVTKFQAAIVACLAITFMSIILVVGFFLFGVQQGDLKEQQVHNDYTLCLAAAVNREAIVNQAVGSAKTLRTVALRNAVRRGDPPAVLAGLKKQLEDLIRRTRADAEKGLPPVVCVKPPR